MTKFCIKCKVDLPVESFGPNKAKKDGKQAACMPCMKEYRKAHYHSNKRPYLDRARALDAKLRKLVAEAKNVPCNSCGIEYPNEPWLMEFDHRDQHLKEDCVSRLIKQGSLTKLLAEIGKCDILCVVCHRRKTAIQLGWIK